MLSQFNNMSMNFMKLLGNMTSHVRNIILKFKINAIYGKKYRINADLTIKFIYFDKN